MNTVSSSSSRALVTGGAGFIGSHLSELLLAQGWDVYVLDDLSTGSIANVAHLSENPRFHLVVDSVLSPAVVNELVYKCDVVYHLAAVGVRLIVERPVHTLVTNVRGTKVVLEHCGRFGNRGLVASSSEVYSDHVDRRPLGETDRRVYGPTSTGRWAYADSKAMDEFLALAYHEERGLDCVIARLFNTVGPRQSGEYGMVIRRFVKAAVGSTERVRMRDLAQRVRDLVGSDAEIELVPYERVYGRGFEDMRHRTPSLDKIFNAIGWEPERDLDETLRDVIASNRSAQPDLRVVRPRHEL